MVPFVKEDPPLRADARRNRDRVLVAAEACFAEQGRGAQMDDIARRAGVGVGTVYRHFPDKDALLRAIAFRIFEQIRDTATAVEREVDDPWRAFTEMMWRCAHVQARNTGFQQALVEGGQEWATEVMNEAAGAQEDLVAVTTRIIDRAKTAGVMREDAGWLDVPTIMQGVCATMVRSKEGTSWERLLAIAIDGMKA